MEKIEFIEVNNQKYPISMFPDAIKQQVATFELIRKQYNESAVTTAALREYMQQVAAGIEQQAKQALVEMLETHKAEPESQGQ